MSGDGSSADAEWSKALRKRVAAVERERDVFKDMYHESEGKAQQALEQQQKLKEAASLASASASASGGGATSRDVPPGREFETHETGRSGNSWTTTMDFQVLTWEPHAVMYRNFASMTDCEHVKRLAATRLSPSGLALRKGDTAAGTADIRTSSGTFLSRRDDRDGVLERIERRIADVTHVHYTHGEPFNVLRYQHGQKYDSHYDTFDPEAYGPQASQRIASFLLYLTDVEEGGETHFPLEGPGGLSRLVGIDYKSCAGGLHVKPRVRTAGGGGKGGNCFVHHCLLTTATAASLFLKINFPVPPPSLFVPPRRSHL